MKTVLFNPFEKYRERHLLILGIFALLLGSYMAHFVHARFDGVLDLHFTKQPTLWKPLADNLVNSVCLTFFLFLAAKYVNKKSRMIDLLVTVLIARIPYYFLLLFNSNNSLQNISEELINSINQLETIVDIPTSSIVLLIVFALCSLLVLVWYLVLLYNGYKVAAHAKGTASIAFFCIALLVSEILSKFILLKI